VKRKGNANESEISKRLIAEGRRLFNAPRGFKEFTGQPEADRLINDLERYPHAFVIGCVMDRQIPAEKAWLIPYRLSQRLGDFRFSTLQGLSARRVLSLMTKPEPLHRFPEDMARNLYHAVQKIAEDYGGDASRIWSGRPSSAEVVYRFLQFRGVGLKIATMAANLLVQHFKIPFSDYYSVDISADVHVRRVFRRLGLVPDGASAEDVIYKARALSPEFPGLLNFPCWQIGREWCRPRKPACGECYMNDVCAFARQQARRQGEPGPT